MVKVAKVEKENKALTHDCGLKKVKMAIPTVRIKTRDFSPADAEEESSTSSAERTARPLAGKSIYSCTLSMLRRRRRPSKDNEIDFVCLITPRHGHRQSIESEGWPASVL